MKTFIVTLRSFTGQECDHLVTADYFNVDGLGVSFHINDSVRPIAYFREPIVVTEFDKEITKKPAAA